ncbi:MAG: hypothetical protein ACE5OZ_18450 [Candidatus Heimdallarchaeota archaeon]
MSEELQLLAILENLEEFRTSLMEDEEFLPRTLKQLTNEFVKGIVLANKWLIENQHGKIERVPTSQRYSSMPIQVSDQFNYLLQMNTAQMNLLTDLYDTALRGICVECANKGVRKSLIVEGDKLNSSNPKLTIGCYAGKHGNKELNL